MAGKENQLCLSTKGQKFLKPIFINIRVLGYLFSDTNTFLSLLWCWDNCLLLFLRLFVCYKSVLFWNGLQCSLLDSGCEIENMFLHCISNWVYGIMKMNSYGSEIGSFTHFSIISQTMPGPKNTNFVVSQHSFGIQTLK